MTERLSDVNARIDTTRQISAVVSAMRAIAAARARDARVRLEGVRRYAHAVGEAIGRALPLAPEYAEAPMASSDRGRRVAVVIGAEQGFAGGFSERVLAAIGGPGADVLLIGDRALAVAAPLGFHPAWTTAMATHLDQIEGIADRVADEIWSRVAGGAQRVALIHATPDHAFEIVTRSLVPFDFGRFPQARGAPPPLTHLPAPDLLMKLAEEYVFAEVCEALALSFAAENQTRIRAMTAAQKHVAEISESLNARARQLRQEEITNEIIELAAEGGGESGA